MKIQTKLLIIIITLAGFLRFYHISTNPPGLYVDEVSFGYNAYSILKTARDEYGNFLPLTLRSFDDYKTPLYAYLLVPTIAVFGLNELAVRFPSAFFGTLTVLVVYFMVKKIFKNEAIGLISALSLAISPWHLQFSRAGFEANVMVFFDVLGFTLILYSRKSIKFLVLSAISFGLAYNSYHGARVWIPLFLGIVSVYYWKDFTKLKQKILIPLVIICIFILPSIINFKNVTLRAREVSIFGKSNVERTFVENYFSQFSPVFLFISGDSIGRHSVPGIGELYIFKIPFVIIGILALLKRKDRNSRLLIAWLLLSPIPASIATPNPHALRGITTLPLWSAMSALGIYVFWKFKMPKYLKAISVTVIGIVAIYNIITYFHLYYVHYPKEKGVDWSAGAKEMVLYVSSVKNNYDKIYITKSYSIPYIYYLFYTKYDPKKYQNEGSPASPGIHRDIDELENIVFYKGVRPETTNIKTLYVGDNGEHPSKVLKEIKLNGNDPIYRIGE